MLDYESLKATAKSIGRPVKELLALSPANDPFYAGVSGRKRSAEWFAGIWSHHGGIGSHLRRLHYRLVTSTAILLPDGGQYENTDNHWQYLVSASLAARYLDLVPFDGLIDRRNGEPMIFATNLQADPAKLRKVSCDLYDDEATVDTPDMPSLPSLGVEGLDAQVDGLQDYIIEVWIEKSTQNDWLVPLCERRKVNLVVGIGEQSEIRSRELALRSSKYGAPVRVIYLSDFDPGGRSMPKAVARKVEFTIAKFGLDNLDIQLIPLALTPDQCREYGLPRIPIKETERRRDKFEQIFGVGATELDALEALHPGELAKLLEAEIDNYIDASLGRRISRVSSDQHLALRRIEEGVYEKYDDEIQRLTDRFQTIVGVLDVWESEADKLWGDIADELDEQRPDLSEVEVPHSAASGETDRFVLFDSKRGYLEQMDAYNAWRDGDES